jgi:hypothetical protein
MPVSFGWIDSGPHRFAFRRAYTGLDPLGRPGNFAAHVLVADKVHLPVAELLGSFRSSRWWEGSEISDTTLETTSLSAFVEDQDQPQDPECAVRVLRAIFRGEKCLAARPEELVAGLAVIAAVTPQLLEERSVSTFEQGDPASWFTLAGIDDADAPQTIGRRSSGALGQLEAAAAQWLVSRTSPLEVAQAQRAWEWARREEPAPALGKFSRLVAVYSGQISAERLGEEDVRTILRDGAIASDLLASPDIRSLACRWLLQGDRQIVTDALASCDSYPESLKNDVAEELAVLVEPAASSLLVVERVTARYGPRAMNTCLDVLARRCLQERRLIPALPAQTLSQVALRAEWTTWPDDAWAELIRSGVVKVAELLRTEQRSTRLITEALMVALRERRIRTLEVVTAACADQQLWAELLRHLPLNELSLVLSAAEAREAVLMLTGVHELPRANEVLPMIESRLRGMGVEDEEAVLCSLASAIPTPLPDFWTQMVGSFSLRRMTADLDLPRRVHRTKRDGFLERTLGPQSPVVMVVVAVSLLKFDRARDALELATPGDEQRTLARYVLDTSIALATRRRSDPFISYLARLAGADAPEVRAKAVLMAGLRGVLAYANPRAAETALGYVANELVEPGLLDQRRGRGLRHGGLQRLTSELVDAYCMMTRRPLEEVPRHSGVYGKRACGWLQSVDGLASLR